MDCRVTSTGIRCGVQHLLFCSFTVVLFCGRAPLAVLGKEDGLCVSQGGRFPKFSLEGHPPKKSSKSSIDLALCRFYRKKTCCDVVQTHAALLSLQRLATSGEASKECLERWEVLECSICDPRVGVTPGPPLLCPSLCDSIFSACFEAYFATEPLSQVLMPCGPRDVLCAKAHEWASNSSSFCQLAGFVAMDLTEDLHSLKEKVCFDGKTETSGSFNTIVDTNHRTQKTRQFPAMDVLKKWMENMSIAEQIMWAIAGLVLTAGALHLRRRVLAKRIAAGTVLRNKILHEEARARQQALYKVSARSARTRKDRKHSPTSE